MEPAADEEEEETTRYAEAGYDSSNFFELLGPVLLMTIIYILWSTTKWLLKKCTINCGNNFLTRRIRVETHHMLVGVRFLLEGCIEIGLSAAITVLMMD